MWKIVGVSKVSVLYIYIYIIKSNNFNNYRPDKIGHKLKPNKLLELRGKNIIISRDFLNCWKMGQLIPDLKTDGMVKLSNKSNGAIYFFKRFLFFRDNYSKPTWGLARLRFACPFALCLPICALPTCGSKLITLPTWTSIHYPSVTHLSLCR